MRTKALAILAAGLAITGTVLQAPATAEAKTHRVQTVRADIDGDGRADSIKVYRLANKSNYRTTYKVIVKTAKGKRAARLFTATGSMETGRITRPLVTVAALDGQKGKELVLKTSARTMGSDADFTYTILTLRKGKLVKEASPFGSWVMGGSGSEGSSSSWWLVFDQVEGVRYALRCTEAQVFEPPTSHDYSVTASAWSHDKWQPGVKSLGQDARCYPEPGSASVKIHW